MIRAAGRKAIIDVSHRDGVPLDVINADMAVFGKREPAREDTGSLGSLRLPGG
jgi:hypothetical protein